MKLRITPESVRLRLNQNEVKKFASEGEIGERISFPGLPSTAFSYTLRSNRESKSGSVQYDSGEFVATVPEGQAKAWANGVSEVGLYFELTAGDGKRLKVAIEKDYQCIDGPAEERDPAGYPNPLAKVGCKTEKR